MTEAEKKPDDPERTGGPLDDADVEGHTIAEEGDDEVAQFNINVGCA